MGSVRILRILKNAAVMAMDRDMDLFLDICELALYLARKQIVTREDMKNIFEENEKEC